MSLTKYETALTQSDKEKDAGLAPARAAEQKGRLGLLIATKEVESKTLDNSIADLSGKYPLDFASLINKLNEKALLTREIAQLKAIGDELFPSS